MKRIYVVKAGTNKYTINDRSTAMTFAEICKNTMEQSKYETLNTVTIELIDVEDEPDPVDADTDDDEDEEEDDEDDEV